MAHDPWSFVTIVYSMTHGKKVTETCVTFTFDRWWYGEYFPSSDPWVEVDKWLAKMARQTEVKGSLTVKLAQQQEDGTALEGYFPEFRKAGGKLG
jgi:hypothetical protein